MGWSMLSVIEFFFFAFKRLEKVISTFRERNSSTVWASKTIEIPTLSEQVTNKEIFDAFNRVTSYFDELNKKIDENQRKLKEIEKEVWINSDEIKKMKELKVQRDNSAKSSIFRM